MSTHPLRRASIVPIDTFFLSLAEDQGERAASIVLAGVGSDGTRGLKAIKAAGGLTIAQAEYDHTALSGMPMSAAATGLVDHIVPVEAMPSILIEHRRQSAELKTWKEAHATVSDWPNHLRDIAVTLRAAIGHDFTDYKQSTLIRRVERRMHALGLDSVPAYIATLKSDVREPDLLFRDLLIGVTQFFRDPDAFAELALAVVPPLLDSRDPDNPIRIWVAGCATGEEVYSIAILLSEALDERKSPVKLQVFGTDLDANAISVARAGRYREPLQGLSPERLAKWFVREGEYFHPTKCIREMCVFSMHSLVKDPPFSKLDLVSCRNVLIYLNRELQHRVIQTFHYALKPGGWLFLSPSESAMRDESMFHVVDRKHRILQRRDDVRPGLPSLRSAGSAVPLRADAALTVPRDDRVDRSVRAAMERHSPAMLVVNQQHEIVRFSGADIGQYLEPTPGTATLNLFALLKKTLRPIVRSSLQKAIAAGEMVVEPDLAIAGQPDSQLVTLVIEPVEGGLVVIAFRKAQDDRLANALASDRHAEATPTIERELNATRVQLRAAVDDLERQFEEAQSATEEMQSVNEELQSANEELETAKEEMQSVNEELQTVNAELQGKNEDLSRLNDDLQNLLDSTRIATLFLDRDLRVRSFTPAMTEIFHLRNRDCMRPIHEIASRLSYKHFERDVATVQRTLTVIESEVSPPDNASTFLMRIRPYRTRDDRLDGVVVTFVDVTAMKTAENARFELETLFRLAQKAAGIGSWTWDFARDVVVSTRENARLMGADPDDFQAVDSKRFMAQIHTQDLPAMEADIARCRAGGGDWEREYRIRRQGQERWLLGKGHLFRGENGSSAKLLGVNYDVTEQKARESRVLFLMNELGHRTKNLLSLAAALIRQTEGESESVREFSERCTERLLALGRAQGLLGETNWNGAGLNEVARSIFEPYINMQSDRILLAGPAVVLQPRTVDSLSLALNELATNAVKYGSLSVPSGKVELRWRRSGNGGKPGLHISWRESGGPPVVAPDRKGFGRRVIEDFPRVQLGASISFDFPSTGVEWTADLPSASVVEES